MSLRLLAFSAPVSTWFRETFGEPTSPQAEGWPRIQRGEHTLILAPTGSGKTLAAFLWGIDQIFRELGGADPDEIPKPSAPVGVRLLYVSPLKALNNDIERNLRAPLAGIQAVAARMGQHLPHVRVAVRTGDTPASVRAAMLKQPPHILITTPESLYLMLTSPRAREMFRGTRTVIVDEIHTLVGEKRGAHLALSLERLERLAGERVQRIGLSATIKPLDEAARFLGGQEWMTSGQGSSIDPQQLIPRPVTIVDTGYRKPLDLQIITPVEDFRNLPGGSIWPSVIPQVLRDVMRHRTTLVFCNNRRLAERTADRLNAQIDAERSEEIPPGSTEALAPGGVPRGHGIFAIGAEGPIRAHHGSTSREARQQMEADLKAGRLPALVGTSSLELGIDIGAVDLVVQLQAPKSVAQGLQRVGRSGHLVGQTSRGRIYVTYREELAEAAAVARGMLEGDVEATVTPRNPLDVLAQQIVAMTSVEDWTVPEMYNLVRQAYPYRELPLTAFHAVLEMLSGKYMPLTGGVPSLRARIAWDRVNDRVAALPGTRLLALSNAGTIPDTGAYDVYLADGKTRVGSLDEEFVFETRVSDTFLLGSHVWRVLNVQDDRIIVADAAGSLPRMPFWRGDYPWRPFELGTRIGRLRREVGERLRGTSLRGASRIPQAGAVSGEGQAAQGNAGPRGEGRVGSEEHWRTWRPVLARTGQGSQGGRGEIEGNTEELRTWLQQEYALDERSARNLVDTVQRQLDAVEVIGTDQTIVVESFTDAVGDGRLVVHSPFGGRVNGAWALAISDAIRERAGVEVETQVNDDGILVRLPQIFSEPPVDVIQRMTAAEAHERILRELPNSAVFGAHFRMNAARALLLPRARGHKRTPFWLQRLKAKDLLAVVRKLPDFPILVETYRDCLRDVLDLPHLEELLNRIAAGDMRIVSIDTVVPSPVAASLMFQFVSVYMYEWDAPKAEQQLGELALRGELLDGLWGSSAAEPATVISPQRTEDLLRPEAIAETVARAGHLAHDFTARSAEELAVILEELGDLTIEEIAERCKPTTPTGDASAQAHAWLGQLKMQRRIVQISIPVMGGSETRWVPAEMSEGYRVAFPEKAGAPPSRGRAREPSLQQDSAAASESILRRFLRSAGPVTRHDILRRYAFDPKWIDEALERLVASREIVRGHFTGTAPAQTPKPAPRSSAAPQPISQEAFEQVHPPDADLRQYCDRYLLEQMRRRTIAILRREVQPVPLSAYARFLARWQGMGSAVRPAGIDSLRATMAQLRGVSLPWPVWERDVLPARIRGYHKGDLGALCEAGEFVWVASGHDPGRALVCFFRRGEGWLFLPPAGAGGVPAQKAGDSAALSGQLGLSDAASLTYSFLKREGASFAADIEAGTALATQSVRGALAELTLASLVTNDTLAALDAVLSHYAAASGDKAPLSTLEAELAALRPRRPATRVLNRDRYHSARKEVARHLRVQTPAEARSPALLAGWLGRWSVVHRSSLLGPAIAVHTPAVPDPIAATLAESQARILLGRYGVLTRECCGWEDFFDWGVLAPQLSRMELRGEVRQGYFVAGLSGIQYALPEAVEALRAAPPERTPDSAERGTDTEDLIVLNATDPANIYGGAEYRAVCGEMPAGASQSPAELRAFSGEEWPRFHRLPSTHVVWAGGRPILIAEDGGQRMTTLKETDAELVQRAVQAYLARPNATRRVMVTQWNGEDALGGPAESILKPIGFHRTPRGLEYP